MEDILKKIEKKFGKFNSKSPEYLKWARAFCKEIKSNPEINCTNKDSEEKEIELKWANDGKFLDLDFDDSMIFFSYYNCLNDDELDEWFMYDDGVEKFYDFICSFEEVYSKQTKKYLNIDNIVKSIKRFRKEYYLKWQ